MTMSALTLPSPPGDDSSQGPSPQQRNVLEILWRGRWIILTMIVLATAGGFFYLSQQTPIYASSSQILIESGGVRIIQTVEGVRAQSENFLTTQCALIKSSQILGPVAELPEIQLMKTFAGADNPIGRLKAGLTVEPGVKDDLIYVTFESPDPQDAANIVNAVVSAYRTYQSNRQRSSNAEVLRILTKEKRERDVELQEKYRQMLTFRQSHPNFTLSDGKADVVVSQLQKFSDALTTARLEVLDAKAASDAVQEMARDPGRVAQWHQQQQQSAADNTPLRAEAQRLEFELTSLRQSLGLDHPKVKLAEAQLEAVRGRIAAQIKELFATHVQSTEQRLLLARQREAELERSAEEQRKLLMAQNTEGAEYAVMEAEAKRIEKLCDLLDTRMKEVKITDNVDPITVTVLESARASMGPVKPKRSVVLFQFIMGGLMLGCGLAYLRSILDKRVSVVDEIPGRLGLNVIGVLPQMPLRETIGVRGQKVQLEPMSDAAESYRTVRTAIYFGAAAGKAKTVLLTSSIPGEGKSTTASNLAIAMAQAMSQGGQRVLLLDCDFRKPTQHRVFGIEDGQGITSVIAGQSLLSQAIKMTPTRGLYILPAGPVPHNPSEILNGQSFTQIIEKLKQKFDCIVIDSPPILPVTDARILAASCDLTIMVVRAKQTKWRDAIRATTCLQSVGSRLLGVVVNGLARVDDKHGYYAYGNYAYGNRKAAQRALAAAQSQTATSNGSSN